MRFDRVYRLANFIRSRNKTAFTVVVGGTSACLKLMIGVVDARNGDVLIYTDPVFGGDPTTAVDRLRKALEKGLKKLLAAAAAK